MVALPTPGSDDDVWGDELNEWLLVAHNADGTAKSGGGSFPSANWCLVQIDGGPGVGGDPTLSVANPSYYYQAAALTITQQSGSDFSVVGPDATHNGGMIVSATGGMFQAGILVAPLFSTAGLDGGSTDLRWVQLGFIMGDLIPDLASLGYDCSFQIGARGQQTFPGLPGISSPGGPTVCDIRWLFENPFGTDSITLDRFDFPCLAIWQIAG